jgi:transposase
MIWADLTPAERTAKRKAEAERLYKQGFTMEQIAKLFGVSHMTIARDLESFNTALKPPRPKGGRPKSSTKPRKVVEKHTKIVNLADAGIPNQVIAKETGVGERMVHRVLEVNNARREAVDKLFGLAAAEHFSKSGALRIEDAIRIHKERLNKTFERVVNEEVHKRIAAADDATREQNKKLRLENLQMQQMLNKRGVFSETQFNNLLKCIHPDNSASTTIRNELLPFLVKNKQRLVTTVH